MGLVPAHGPGPLELDDGIALESRQPVRTGAVEPRGRPLVHDPEPRLLPGSVRTLRPQRDHLAPDLDDGEVTEHEDGRRGSQRQDPEQDSLHSRPPVVAKT
jgi:hypothetical protein